MGSKHWGWILAKYFKVETILSSARPEVSVYHKPNSTYSTESFTMVQSELETRVEKGRYVIIRGSPFLSSMTAIPKGDLLPNRNIISRDSRDPAIEALQKLPPERRQELHKMDRQLQELQQSSNNTLEPRSINHVKSVAFKKKPKVNFKEEVEVTHYSKNDPLSEPGNAPLGKRLFPYDQPQEFPTSRITQNYPGCFKTPIDEEIFIQLSWIANIGTRSRESLLSKNETYTIPLYIMKNLPTIRKTVYPLQYSVNMLPTPHSRRYSSEGSFLTTARALQTMDTLMHNFKGGPKLVKQDSILHGNITAALRKLPHT